VKSFPGGRQAAWFLLEVTIVMLTRYRFGILAVGLLLMTTLAGCSIVEGRSNSRPEGYLISAFDRTGSTQEIRARQLSELYDLVDRAHIYRTETTLWALDNKPTIIWDGGVPPNSDDETFIQNVKTELAPTNSTTAAKIARPGRMLATVNQKLDGASLPKGPLVLFISTDGAMEDPSDNKTLAHEARVFNSKHPNACVILSGVESRNRAAWDRAFGKMPRNLLFVGSPTDHERALKRFRDFMKGNAR
jgi:hypothetical protein